jgi:branched-subunit amino acid ABC-type transport system permease component
MVSVVSSAIVAGLGVGSIYALIALGYTLTLGASGVFNFAQGSAVMAGALVSFGVGTAIHLPVLAVVGIVVATGAVAGVITHAVAIEPLVRRIGPKNLTFGTFLSTLGALLAFNSVISLGFGDSNVYPVHSYAPAESVSLFGTRLRTIYIIMLGVAIVLVALFELVSRHTSAGLVMRAIFNDGEGASVVGIRVTAVIRWVFVGGCAVAALAGFLIAPITSAQTGIADQYAFYGFAAMAIGGYGSFMGAATGGLLVGLIGQVPLIWLTPNASGPIIYGAMLLILLVRPQGIFGAGGTSFGAAAIREV